MQSFTRLSVGAKQLMQLRKNKIELAELTKTVNKKDGGGLYKFNF